MIIFIQGLMENHIVSGTYFTKGMRENDKFTTLLGQTIQVDSIKGNLYRCSSVHLSVCPSVYSIVLLLSK